MSIAAPARDAAPWRDPGRVYPPPPVSTLGLVLRWVAAAGWYGIGVAAIGLTLLLGGRAPAGTHTPLWLYALDLLGGAVMLVAVLWRRRIHWLALWLAPLTALSFSGWLAYGLIFTSMATRRRWRELVITAAVNVLAGMAVSLGQVWLGVAPSAEEAGAPMPTWLLTAVGVAFQLAWLAICATTGYYIGARRDLLAALEERASNAEREAALQVAAGQAAERVRIAREMHDVLAHRISLVSMHAGVLAFRDDLPPEKTREIAGIIQENAHASLTELRSVLGELRGTSGAEPERPQPTLLDVGELVAAQESLGQVVHLDNQVRQVERLSPTVSRHVFRILQETLTNARKHAAGAPVWVSLWGRPGDGLSLEVRNATTQAAGVPGSGVGLIGLQERVSLVGGRIEAGLDHGDYVVKAWVPWQT